MILDSELLTEIQNDPLTLGFAGAGARPIHQKLTAEGSASTQNWIVAQGLRPVLMVEFLQLLDVDESAALDDTVSAPVSNIAKALRFKISHTDTIDMTLQANRDMVGALQSVDDVPIIDKPLKAATVQAMLRKGEVLQSRANELWGEEPTIEQIRSVLNG